MIICSSFFHTQLSTRIHPRFDLSHQCRPNANIEKTDLVPKGIRNKLLIPGLVDQEAKWDFARISMRPNSGRLMYNKAGLNVHATMCASSLFNLGTAIVLPLYILMIIAPQHKMFQRAGVLFFSELSAAAAWIHLLLMDLFATRYVFLDGLRNEVETRHSVVICLFFFPMGILSHFVTRTLTKWSTK